MIPEERELVDRVEKLITMIGAKWKPAIMFYLVFQGTKRFSEIRKAIPDLTQKMLTQRLRELERDGFVKRFYYEEIPPRVEYQVTDLGMTLHPLYRAICDWGGSNMPNVQSAIARYDRAQKDRSL